MEWWRDAGYSPRRPLRPGKGIRAKTQWGAFGKTWWAGRWIAALANLVDSGRLAKGRSYARGGQVVSLDVGPDGVEATVQGSRVRPYDVDISFSALSDAAWEQVLDGMAGQALYAARLLSGEMPEQIEEVFSAVGASLFPAASSDLVTDCSCPDWANPCKHVAAVYYLLGERFDEDPFLMFLLRGRTREQIAGGLRARRLGAAAADGTGEPAKLVAEEADLSLLASVPAGFWGSSASLDDLAFSFALPPLDAAAIKRLGPPPFWSAKRDFTARMEQAYRAVSAHALRLAFGED